MRQKRFANRPSRRSRHPFLFLPILGLLLLVFCLGLLCASSCSKGEKVCHHRNLDTSVIAPTCSDPGYTLNTCVDCGYSFKSDYTASKGHTLSHLTVEPTCHEQGYTLYTCSRCGFTYQSSFVPPKGHTYEETVTEPTCTEQGYTTYTCKDCKEYYISSYTDPKGHSYTSKVVAPTCEEQGYTEYTCTVCGDTYRSHYTSPKGHTFEKEQVTPTCIENGYTIYTCKDCHLQYTSDLVPPRGHSFRDEVIRPGIGTTGYTIHSCSCGYSYISDYAWYSDIFHGSAGSGKVVSYGVDLSYHNGDVDFELLKEEGIEFVILRCGRTGAQDTMFETYYEQASAAGLDIGAYFYSYALTVEEMRADAELAMQIIGTKKMTYPIFLDMERDDQAALPTETLMDLLYVFCSELYEHNYFAGLYTNKDWMEQKWNAEQVRTLYEVWFARYPAGISSLGKAYYANTYSMWQYSNKGTLQAVPNSDVDMNVCYKNYPMFMAYWHFNNC